jgi:hypothetical protein
MKFSMTGQEKDDLLIQVTSHFLKKINLLYFIIKSKNQQQKTPAEQFQNPISKSYIESKSIHLTYFII